MKKTAVVMLALAMTMVASACGSSTPAPAANSQSGGQGAQSNAGAQSGAKPEEKKEVAGTINLYTSEAQDLVNDMIADFKKKNPKVDVKIFRSGTGDVISKMEAEKTAGKIQADVIWFADVDYFSTLAKNNLLLKYDSPEAKNLDKRYAYEDGKYYEVRQIFNVIGYNTAKIKKAPTSWKDLAGADFKGKVAIANPNYSGAAFQTLATFVNDKGLGWDYFNTLKNNGVKFEQSNGNLASKLSSGEYYGVSVVDFMVRNAKNSGSPVDIAWPSEGAVLIPTPVGIINDSANKEPAQKLVDYLLSQDGQKFFVKQGYIPVKTDVGSPEGSPKLDTIKVFPLDMDFISKNRDSIKKKFLETFADAK
ncbi:ABC transporter substrate-binding protein [Paenibacillus thalictri]|nr:ABC transporter substrate-binding protein [Paenibacillus thalictri]